MYSTPAVGRVHECESKTRADERLIQRVTFNRCTLDWQSALVSGVFRISVGPRSRGGPSYQHSPRNRGRPVPLGSRHLHLFKADEVVVRVYACYRYTTAFRMR